MSTIPLMSAAGGGGKPPEGVIGVDTTNKFVRIYKGDSASTLEDFQAIYASGLSTSSFCTSSPDREYIAFLEGNTLRIYSWNPSLNEYELNLTDTNLPSLYGLEFSETSDWLAVRSGFNCRFYKNTNGIWAFDHYLQSNSDLSSTLSDSNGLRGAYWRNGVYCFGLASLNKNDTGFMSGKFYRASQVYAPQGDYHDTIAPLPIENQNYWLWSLRHVSTGTEYFYLYRFFNASSQGNTLAQYINVDLYPCKERSLIAIGGWVNKLYSFNSLGILTEKANTFQGFRLNNTGYIGFSGNKIYEVNESFTISQITGLSITPANTYFSLPVATPGYRY